MPDLFDILQTGHYSLVVRNGKMKTFTGRGVSDLYRLYSEDSAFLQGAEIADKVVGKAAASLMILGGVRKLQTGTVSRLALELLRKYPVEVSFQQEVPHIENRSKTGWCPLESRCRDLQTPQECLSAITGFINEQKLKS